MRVLMFFERVGISKGCKLLKMSRNVQVDITYHPTDSYKNRQLIMKITSDNRFSREALYRTLELKNLKERWETHGLILIFKLLHNLAPPSLSSRIEFKSQSNYTLRSNNTQIVLPRPRTNFVRNSALYSTSKLFIASQ